MKLKDIKVGMKVIDRWWSRNPPTHGGTGQVVKVLKTRVHVGFRHGTEVYDTPHLQFLELKTTKVEKVLDTTDRSCKIRL